MFGVKDTVDGLDRRTGNGRGVPRWVFATLVIAVLGVAGFFLARQLTAPAPTPPPQTATVRRGNIDSTVNATGSVIAQTNAKLGFKTAGRISEVSVKPGETVQEGQALAKLETTDLSLQVAQQRAALASAQAKLATIQAGPRPEDVTAAQASLANAQANLDSIKAGAVSADISAAQQAVAAASSQVQTARANLTKLRNGASSQDIRNAQLQVTQARNKLSADVSNRNYVCGLKNDPNNPTSPSAAQIKSQCDAAKATVASDQNSVTIAQNNLSKLRTPATTAEINAARASVTAAENAYNSAVAKLNDAKNGPTEAQLAAAEAQLASAQASLVKAQKPYTDADLQGAQAAVDQAQAQLDLAQYNLSNATLTAPFAGVVSAVNVTPGELTSSANPAIVLVNPADIRLDINVDETDVASVAPGQKARVLFDALSGKEFDGVVTAVAPNATISSGVSTYPVSIDIANAEGVRPGMTGNAGVIFAEKPDALLVPNRAIRREGRDRYVEVLVGDKQEKRPVKIGMSNDQETEILEGVNEGESVVINATTTFRFDMANRSGGGAMAKPSAAQ